MTTKSLVRFILAAAIAAVLPSARAEDTTPKSDDSGAALQIVQELPLLNLGELKRVDEALSRVDLRARLATGFDREHYGMGVYWLRRVEPSFRLGATTLVDEYDLSAFVKENFAHDSTNDRFLGVGLGGQVRILFARQFVGDRLKDHLGILIEKPYTPFTHLPTDSQKALDRLKVDDFVAFTANLNLIVSASQLTNFAPHFVVSPSVYYMLSGEFQIHVYRLADDKFRLKIVGLRTKEAGFNLRVGYDGSETTITRISLVNDVLRHRLNFSPLQINFGWPRGKVFMVDYVADFKNPEVRQAYDDLMKSILTVRGVRRVDPTNMGDGEVEKMIIGDISRLEDLYNQDKDKSAGDRAVDRMFKGSDEIVDGNTFGIRLGQQDIAQVNFNRSYTENVITAVDQNGRSRQFFLPDYRTVTGSRAFLSFFNEETQNQTNVLFEENENKELLGLGELSFFLDYRDRKFTAAEISDFQKMLKSQLPSGIYDQIDWRGWDNGIDRVNARVTSRIVFRPEALDYVNEISGLEIYERLVKYLNDNGPFNVVTEDPFGRNGEATVVSRDAVDYYRYDLSRITYALANMFNSSYSARERGVAFVQLKTNPLWSEIGAGFLMRLLEDRAKKQKGADGEQDLMSKVFFETTWEAKNSDFVHFIYGSCKNRQLYRSVMYIYSILSNREIDLRLIDQDPPSLPGKGVPNQCQD